MSCSGTQPLLLLLASALLVSTVSAHGIMRQPVPRDGMSVRAPTYGTKFSGYPPAAGVIDSCSICRGKAVCTLTESQKTARGAPTAVVRPGSKFMVRWEVGIPHPAFPGVRLAIRYAEADAWTVLAGGSAAQLESANEATAWKVRDDDTPGQDVGLVLGEHYLYVDIPAKEGLATIQWVWVSKADQGTYTGCADIEVSSTKDVMIQEPENVKRNAQVRTALLVLVVVVVVMLLLLLVVLLLPMPLLSLCSVRAQAEQQGSSWTTYLLYLLLAVALVLVVQDVLRGEGGHLVPLVMQVRTMLLVVVMVVVVMVVVVVVLLLLLLLPMHPMLPLLVLTPPRPLAGDAGTAQDQGQPAQAFHAQRGGTYGSLPLRVHSLSNLSSWC